MGWKDFRQSGKLSGRDKVATLGLLIVDDERDIVDSLTESFRGVMTVYPAYSAEEALRLFRDKEIHVVLSDQRMPDMTGVELFAKVKAINPMPIRILLTGYSDINVVIKGLNEGLMWKYVTKPWDPDDLKNIVIQGAKQYLKDSGQDEQQYRLMGF
ncbi:MAG TPA: response regulator [Polyangiaceae bacterium]|jgi:two-component system response regulator HupR/HoxA|nr:response regulator [Polyangiaceae bacterium]